jgi:acid phosphatase (class A)
MTRQSFLLFSMLLLGACASVPPTRPGEIAEYRPGVLVGYLDGRPVPQAARFIGPPPQAGSPEAARDLAVVATVPAGVDGPRWQLAIADDVLVFPKAFDTFACALGFTPSEAETPHLATLIRRVGADAGRTASEAKDVWPRPRPFLQFGHPICAAHERERLEKSGSYPSGHAAIGWGVALVLSELVPGRAEALLARGLAYGQSRVVCGVHWPSDVEAGQRVAAGALAATRRDPVYQAQFQRAAREIAAGKLQPPPPAEACAAEAATLGLPSAPQ